MDRKARAPAKAGRAADKARRGAELGRVSIDENGLALRGWDFERPMTRNAATWDDVVDLQPGLPVQGNAEFSEGEAVRVTKEAFDRAVRSAPRRTDGRAS